MTNAYGGDRAGNVCHGIVDGEAGIDGPAWGIDVEVYGLFWGFCFEIDELGFHARRDGIIDGAIEEDNTFLWEIRVGNGSRR